MTYVVACGPKVVWKFAIPIRDYFELGLPVHSTILHVGTQNGVPYLWALCNPAATDKVKYRFRLAGTGHPIEYGPREEWPTYLGTFMLHEGGLVFHLFLRSECGKDSPEDVQ